MTDLPPPDPGLIATFHQFLGGAATALIAAFSGRAMYHAGEVRARRRPILSWDLAWEIPTAVGMAIAGDALGTYMGLTREVTVGVIAVLSYLGPRGAGAMVERWAARKGVKEPKADGRNVLMDLGWQCPHRVYDDTC